MHTCGLDRPFTRQCRSPPGPVCVGGWGDRKGYIPSGEKKKIKFVLRNPFFLPEWRMTFPLPPSEAFSSPWNVLSSFKHFDLDNQAFTAGFGVLEITHDRMGTSARRWNDWAIHRWIGRKLIRKSADWLIAPSVVVKLKCQIYADSGR